jgi:hypothetical protein
VAGELGDNALLAALPDAGRERWRSHLEPVELPLGAVLYEAGNKLTHVYFPTTAIVSLICVMDSGATTEIAIVGNEGVVGVSLFMGGESTTSRAVVQSAGRGLRLKASQMMEEFNRTGPAMYLLLRYTQALITQMAQTAVCNRHHSLEQQLCRWLLLSLDRLRSNEFAGRPQRGGHRSCRPIARGRTHQVPQRSYHGARPCTARTSLLRMLCGRQEGIQSATSRQDRGMTVRAPAELIGPSVRCRTDNSSAPMLRHDDSD